ncbi:glutathione-specific gamma-glutamylcyclotransferase 1 [Pristis pectinata]|uniref:glutathione-specific gamma-glutamylcyclotransferase 1 n=1 Tax=Pristis pectinata TaxID=685728 RepID=UPI00223CC513|nr:glutathione-specific gamma-glutamylcyclotransferase 1 [Pristis pectinata]
MPPQEAATGDGAAPQDRAVWIFGYGSLIWKPDFEFTSRRVGFIRGYCRRFWHGDNHYRGDKRTPGRVVTLLEDAEADTWGVAYEVRDEAASSSLERLWRRECLLGGYVCRSVQFYGREAGAATPALVYVATADNPLYLGPAEPALIAWQIVGCSGHSGRNLDYLLRLADFMRRCCPHVEDPHLFAIEAAAVVLTSAPGSPPH